MIHSFKTFVENKKFIGESQIFELEFFSESPDLKIDPNSIEVTSVPNTNKEENKSDSKNPRTSVSNPKPDEVSQENKTTDYVTKSGDSLSLIAKKFGMEFKDWKKIYDLNKKVIGSNPNSLKTGIKLTIPGKLDPNYQGTKEQNKTKTEKKVLISDSTNVNFIPKLKLSIDKLDSSKSNVIFNIEQPLGCATFVNQFSDAVDAVDDAWKSRDVIDGTLIYDVFDSLTKEEIQNCINIWNKIYSRPGTQKWKDKGIEEGNIKNFISNLIKKKPLNSSILKVGDICGIFYPPSFHHEEAFFEGGKNYFTDKNGKKGMGNIPGRTITSGKGWTSNTHLGIVGAIENGKPLIIHATPRSDKKSVNIWADGVDKLKGGGKIVWVERPKTTQNPKNL